MYSATQETTPCRRTQAVYKLDSKKTVTRGAKARKGNEGGPVPTAHCLRFWHVVACPRHPPIQNTLASRTHFGRARPGSGRTRDVADRSCYMGDARPTWLSPRMAVNTAVRPHWSSLATKRVQLSLYPSLHSSTFSFFFPFLGITMLLC